MLKCTNKWSTPNKDWWHLGKTVLNLIRKRSESTTTYLLWYKYDKQGSHLACSLCPDQGRCKAAEIQSVGKFGSRAELHWGISEGFFGTMEMPQWRDRTWLQLMCCTLALELGVLISEWTGKVWWVGVWWRGVWWSDGAESAVLGQMSAEARLIKRKMRIGKWAKLIFRLEV